MESVLPIVLMLTAVLVSSVVAQIFPKAPASLVQIALGVLLAVTPAPVNVTLDPEFFLLFFIAPLLYWDAMEADKEALWRDRWPVMSLAVGLVVVIVVVVGLFTHLLVPSIPLAVAFALGAALGPTDAVAVTTLGKRLAIDPKQKSVLQGECLINDASGVVSFQFAIAALATGAFSVVDAGTSLVGLFVGGVALGALLALVKVGATSLVRKTGLEDVTFHVLVQLLTPFAVYIVAEELHVSGILAVVAAGIVDSFGNRSMLPSAARLGIVSSSVWKVISFALNGMVFVLLGTLLPSATVRTWAGSIPNATLVMNVVLITAVLVAVRFAWCLGMERMKKGEDGKRRRLDATTVKNAAILTLGGPKGAVTLSICLTIPRIVGGEVVACRELVLFLGAGVILLTLLLANFVVPLLVPKIETDTSAGHESEGRIWVLRRVMEELGHDEKVCDKQALRRVLAMYEKRIRRIRGVSETSLHAEELLRERAVAWETLAVNKAIREGRVIALVGYGYLFELERKLSRIHHKGQLSWLLRNATGWFGLLWRSGFQDLGSSEEARARRFEAHEALKAECADAVLRNLKALAGGGEFDEEVVTRVSLDYSRQKASALSASSAVRPRLLQGTAKVDAVMVRALQFEREQIRRAYDEGLISRETARLMRDNVATMEYGMQE